MVTPRIHLDHQSGSAVRAEVFRAMRPWFDQKWGNPASLHSDGLEARDAIEQARNQAARLLQAGSPEEVVFTSGGTESLNLAIKGAAWSLPENKRRIVTSNAESPTVASILQFLESTGFEITRVPVDHNGHLPPDAVRQAIGDHAGLLVTHWAHHELGAIQPVSELARLAQEQEVTFIVDAIPALGWTPVSVQIPGISMLACSTHRVGGPRGTGLLWRRRGVRLVPIQHGSGQEFGVRGGTENVPGIVGTGCLCEILGSELPSAVLESRIAQQNLWNRIQERIPYVQLNGPAIGESRLPNLLHLSVEFVEGEGVVLASDFAGLSLASGYACTNRALRTSPSLEAIGLPHRLAASSVLLSLGRFQAQDELFRAAEILAGVVAKLRKLSDEWHAFEEGKVDSLIVPMSILEDTPEVRALRLKPRPSLNPRAHPQKPGKLPGF